MSESEDKRELGGLARSIDTLFSSAGAGSTASKELEESEVDGSLEGEAAELAAEVAESAAPTPAVDDVTPSPFHDVPEVGAEIEPASAESTLADLVSESAFDTPEATADVSRPVATTGGRAPDEVEPPEELAPSPATPTDGAEAVGDEGEPSPLLSAVESFLTGEADDTLIRTLAAEHVGARAFDPVAAAVEHLVLGAGEPPDAKTMSLVEDLLDPIVRNRVVRRMGEEHDEGRRERYHLICTRLGEPMAMAIRDEMADAERHARRAYVDALVAMADVSRPIVEAMVEDENRFLARNGVKILGDIGGSRAEELVVAALANTDPRVRREALRSMARLKVADADQLIIGLLEDTDQTVRLAAVVAAGELGIERAVRHLVAMLGDVKEEDVVLPILHALGQIGDPGAVPAIEKHVARPLFGKARTEVRIAAYQALNHIGTPHARRLLNRALSDKDPQVSTAVKELLHLS
jgi:hypothetical protein